ncbi:phosphotriesterase-related protein [Fodinibius roseus]|uniref:Phosphotriesterase-related protein n=2 Tax=Fodinibius roseus TaxID=1194090 RepID=A0A1M5F3K1_9BACT|nr:phosphotriesterase-related protein [Fodinibius roseus]
MKTLLCILTLIGFTACQQSNEGKGEAEDYPIMTVTGEISASEMDTTLIHEHVLVDWIGADSTGYHRWDRDEVVERALPFIREAAGHGVQTILDCTPAYLGRDPWLLQELSEQSGVRLLTNTGYYGAVDNKFMPRHARQESAEELAGRWIDEFRNGIEDSGVKPGFIKISVAGNGPLSDLHQKIVRAAARTHLQTGLTIVSHTTGDRPALAQVEILKEMGVSPSAWVWTHAQAGTLENQIRIAREGGWISLDNVSYVPSREGDNGDNDDNMKWFVERISELDESGLLDRVLISHDAGYYNPDEDDGGDFREYTDIFEYLLPALRKNGFTNSDIDQLLVQNPREAYGIRTRTAQ